MKLAAALAGLAVTAALGAAPPHFGRLPISFEQNRGQFPSEVLYQTNAAGPKLSVCRRGVRVQLDNSRKKIALEMDWAQKGYHPRVEGENRLAGESNYLIGDNRSRWITGVPVYQRIRVHQAYKGVDVVLYGNGDQLEYDLVVSPGADAGAIALRFRGAERLEKSASGDLVITSGSFTIRQRRPRIYQQIGDSQIEVPGEYVLARGGQVGFRVASYKRNRPLVIDPAISFSTLFGGTGIDHVQSLALDAAGNIYLVGDTTSLDFPLFNPAEALPPAQNASGNPRHIFVTKLDPTGSSMLFSTYLGGSVGESGRKIAVDGSGNVYVGGSTVSPNYPTTFGALQPAGGANGFDHIALTKLSPSGSAILYSAVIGGLYDDELAGLAVDVSGNCFLAGTTNSPDFPVTPGARNDLSKLDTLSSLSKIFVMKVNSSATAPVYSSVIGGSGIDEGAALAIDSGGSAYVAGATNSSDFPVTSAAYQAFSRVAAPNATGFVLKLSSDGSTIKFASYLGGSSSEQIVDIALDTAGKIYVAGLTTSPDFPLTPGTYFAPATNAVNSVFVSKLSADGSALNYSTVFGGSTNSLGAIAVDGAGRAVVTGSVDFGFPVLPGAPQIYPGDGASARGRTADAFVIKLNSAGTGAAYSTYLGGNDARSAAVAVDSTGAAVITGTGDTTFPVTSGAFRSVAAGQVFVAKISDSSSCTYTVTASSPLSASVATQTGCKWISVAAAPWLAVASGSSGSGSGTVQIVAQQNNGSARSGQVSIAGTLFTVNQPGGCQVVLSSTGQSFASDGGSSQFSAFTSSGCPLPSAAPNVSWVHLLSTSGSISFSVDRNSSGQARTGTIFVGSQSLTIFQSSAPCSYSVTVTSPAGSSGSPISVGSSAVTGSLDISTQSGCFWSASSSVPWVSLGNIASYSGSGTAVFSVSPNSAAARSGTISVAGQALVVKQARLLSRLSTAYPGVFRWQIGTWYSLIGNSVLTQQWGVPGDIPVPADYDGDGKTDYAVWRPWTGMWYVIPSSNPATIIAQKLGSPGDVPVPGDFDGDGKADFAVWNPPSGNWSVIPSRNTAYTVVQQWGNPGDIPVPGDYDGDGRIDFAVWRQSSGIWYVIPSSSPGTPLSRQWGNFGDIPVPGDYDGDGRTDFAVWRQGSGFWYVIPSSSPNAPLSRQWGNFGDVPVPGDYDGDGRTDFAVWRPAIGTWYIIPSRSPGQPTATQWGIASDFTVSVFQ